MDSTLVKYIIGIFLALSLFSCNSDTATTISKADLRVGDVIFVSSLNSDLTKAIDEVTQTSKATHYVHMGIVSEVNGDFKVLHSDTDRGVTKESLESFQSDRGVFHVYRAKQLNESLIAKAIEDALLHVGEPYNFTYIISDSGYYCSELIYEIFEPQGVFQLNPMTFKNAGEEGFNPTWEKYYSDLGIAVPEGEPGCNPNGMAESDRLNYLGLLTN